MKQSKHMKQRDQIIDHILKHIENVIDDEFVDDMTMHVVAKMYQCLRQSREFERFESLIESIDLMINIKQMIDDNMSSIEIVNALDEMNIDANVDTIDDLIARQTMH